MSFKSFKDYILILGFIYLPHLKIGDFILNTLYFYLIWALIQIFIKRKFFFPSVLVYIFPIQIVFLWFSFAFNAYIEFSLLKEIIIFPLYYSAGALITYDILKRRNISYLLRLISYSLITNSVIILTLVIFKDFNFIFHEFIHITAKQQKYIYDLPLNIRHSGLSVSGFSYLSFKTVCLYFIILFYQYQERKLSKKIIYFTSVTVIFSMIFIARTGLLIGLFGFLIYMFLANRKIFLLLSATLVFNLSVIIGFLANSDQSNIKFAFERSFDLFFNDEKNGTIEDLEYELNSFDLGNFIFGDKNYGRDKGLISDIGYISFLKGGGILGIIFLTMHWIIIISKTIYIRKSWVNKGLFYLVILHLIFNAKELVFYGHGYIQAIIILLILYEFKKRNHYNSFIPANNNFS